jgi:20S proteasome alpha/beta subunit
MLRYTPLSPADARSFSLTTFSPSGKLVQIEHALAAVAGGTTSLGIKGECVVLGCDVSLERYAL